MKKLLFATGIILTLSAPAVAQSWGRGGAYTGASPSARYYPGSGTHWCSWSAASVCAKWRARGGRFNCAPGNMSQSCQLQRRMETRR
jgi:hypothetical protein